MPERSEANAKEATQNFSKKDLNPITDNGESKSKPGITFAAQDKLPKLPIPDLEATCKRYLASLDPLQNAREHHDSERAIEEFLKTDGPGLQEKLKTYAEGQTSYIEQFCKYSMYIVVHATNTLKGMTRILTSTIPWCSTSTRSFFSKMIRLRLGTTR
jgi:hypothetical protein